MSVDQRNLPAASPVGCGILTVSDSRTLETDASGRAIADLLVSAGHGIVARRLVRDEAAEVEATVRAWAERSDVQLIITTGGTGIARRDTSYEAIHGLLHRELPGFGELFRALSFEEIGPAAMLSRAVGGTIGRVAVFVLPGSEGAVRLAMTRLILPQVGHLVRELNRFS